MLVVSKNPVSIERDGEWSPLIAASICVTRTKMEMLVSAGQVTGISYFPGFLSNAISG